MDVAIEGDGIADIGAAAAPDVLQSKATTLPIWGDAATKGDGIAIATLTVFLARPFL